MQFCKKCVLPSTKPGISFDENGVCSACNAVELKQHIDWKSRRDKLAEICSEAKLRAASIGSEYDCVVPVSGGKDSVTQCFVMSKVFGMRVLAVIILPHVQTEEGIRNLNSLVENLGVDLVRIGVQPTTLKKIRRTAFFKIGNPSYAEHRVMFAAVAREAFHRNIPLVVWGEDIGIEFGGKVDKKSANSGDASNLINNDLFHESSFDDLISGTDVNNLFFYNPPTPDDQREFPIKSIYLGFYYWWDGIKHYNIARQFGFLGRMSGPLPGHNINFDNIDEKLCEVHCWMKYPKFGFWRPHDHTSYKIWNGYMTRDEAVKEVLEIQNEQPAYIDEFLDYHEISQKDYDNYIESIRNTDLWEKKKGKWRLKYELK